MTWSPLSEHVRDLRRLASQVSLELPPELAREWEAAKGAVDPMKSAFLRSTAREKTPEEEGFRDRCVGLALRHFSRLDGVPLELENLEHLFARAWGMPAFFDVCELALRVGPQLLVHHLRPAATETVHATDLHGLPGEPPRLLRRPFLIEAVDCEHRSLFGSTSCLAGIPRASGDVLLIGLQRPDGIAVTLWQPVWGERDLEHVGDGIPVLLHSGTEDAHRAWSNEAARFLTVLSMLLEAEGTPLQRTDRGGRLPNGQTPRPGQGWTERVVERTVRISETDRETRTRAPHAGTTTPIAGRAAAVVPVAGYLCRKPHGPGNRLRKTVYVAGYSARRYVASEARVHVV